MIRTVDSTAAATLFLATLMTFACGDAGGESTDDTQAGSSGLPGTSGTSTPVTDSGDSTDPTDATDSTDPPTDTTTGDPGGPSIDMLYTDKMTIAEGDLVTITAFVSDPDGLDDIVGGALLSQDGGQLYGPFTQVAGGTYELVTSWAEINAVESLDFVSPGQRVFLVQFSDNANLKGSRLLALDLDCETEFGCGGVCVDSSPENCHGCGIVCAQGEVCGSQACTVADWGPCVSPDTEWSCEGACADIGQVCVNGGCGGEWAALGYADEMQCQTSPEDGWGGTAVLCEDTLEPLFGEYWVRCCCAP